MVWNKLWKCLHKAPLCHVQTKKRNPAWPNIPSSNVSWVRNTAALFCITRCILRRIFEVGSEPFEFLNLSSQAMVLSPASFSRGFCFCPIWVQNRWAYRICKLIMHDVVLLRKRINNLPGLLISETLFAQALPKTTISRRELAPRRFAPWTDAQAASPAAISPGITASGSLPFMSTTWKVKYRPKLY